MVALYKTWFAKKFAQIRGQKDEFIEATVESAEAACEASILSFASDPNILSTLTSSINGLTHEEAAKRLQIYGENKQLNVEDVTWKRIAFQSVFNDTNELLLVLAIISVCIPDREWSFFAIVMIAVGISSIMNFVQDYANMKARTGQADILPSVKVRRVNLDGVPKKIVVDRKDVVRGDILPLNPGDVIPADCIVLESSNLSVGQSSLTGEGEPQVKVASGACKILDANATIFDLQNVLYCGTHVISGSGLALVVSTGSDAFISTVMKKLNGRRPLNSFQKGVRTTCLFLIAFLVVSFTIILVLKGTKTSEWQKAAIFALSTAATMVPEMLPAVVAANLSRGSSLLRKSGVAVNHMEAIHNLGSMTVLCSDKTGTLTKDEIELCHCLDTSGRKSPEVLKMALTNARSQSGTKNAIDSAIINHVAVEEKTFDIEPSVGEIPFNFEARRSSCIIRTASGSLKLICKGAFEEVMALCSNIHIGAIAYGLNEERRSELTRRVGSFNAQSYRVVLVASRDLKEADIDDQGCCSFAGLDNEMTVEGFLTFLDPLKEDAKESVQRLQKLGVSVRILTGDNIGVALSVARSLELAQDVEDDLPLAISGPELAHIQDQDEWAKTVKHCKIFAKLTPAQKGQVVETLQAHGEVVGMIGDGINDSIALNTADIGVSVNTGSSVAKHSADLILTDKELSKVVDAVLIGRKTHGNIMKYMKMILAANFGNIISVVVASVWFPFDPVSPAQMILQNLLYDLSQITIPFDNVDPEYLTTPHRFSIWDMMRFIFVIGPMISTIDIGVFNLNVFYYGLGPSSDPRGVEKFQCAWFIQGILSQTLVIYVLRTTKIPFFQGHPSKYIVFSTVIAAVVGFVVPYIPPFAKALKMVRPGGDFIGILIAFLVLYAIVLQLTKMGYIKIWKRWL